MTHYEMRRKLVAILTEMVEFPKNIELSDEEKKIYLLAMQNLYKFLILMDSKCENPFLEKEI